MRFNKKILILGVISITLIILGLVGFTYSFFTAGVEGNEEANETEVTAGTLRIRLTDTEVISISDALPGRMETKTFTVENIGDAAASYNINLIDVSSTFVNDELVYSLTSNNDGGTVSQTPVPTINSTISEDIIIDAGITQTYTLAIKFLETGENQNSNQGALFTSKIQISPTKIGGLLAGYLTDSNGNILSNTKMSLHSDPVETTTNTDGYYEFKNVPAGEHTINVLNNSDEVVASKNVTVKLSNNTNVEGNIIKTTPKLTKYVNIEVTNANINLVVQDMIRPIMEKIITAETPKSDANIDFSLSYFDEEMGLYYTADAETYGEDGTRIYYYRGDVDNNWVSFGGYYWRIVRTTAEGGVKLVYSGGNTQTGTSSLTETSGSITVSMFNTSNDSKYYAGYTYNSNLSQWDGPQTNSNVKSLLDSWYSGSSGGQCNCTFNGSIGEYECELCDFIEITDPLSNYENYLSETAVYCNDRSSERIEESQNYTIIYFPAASRVYRSKGNLKPTFACNKANGSRYTVIANAVNGDNGYLTYPIAMLSIDEIRYAGFSNDYDTTLPYLLDNMSTTEEYMWTMSPESSFDNGTYLFDLNDYIDGHFLHGANIIRPAVSLKSCVTVIGGDGSVEHPYELSNESCELLK